MTLVIGGTGAAPDLITAIRHHLKAVSDHQPQITFVSRNAARNLWNMPITRSDINFK